LRWGKRYDWEGHSWFCHFWKQKIRVGYITSRSDGSVKRVKTELDPDLTNCELILSSLSLIVSSLQVWLEASEKSVASSINVAASDAVSSAAAAALSSAMQTDLDCTLCTGDVTLANEGDLKLCHGPPC